VVDVKKKHVNGEEWFQLASLDPMGTYFLCSLTPHFIYPSHLTRPALAGPSLTISPSHFCAPPNVAFLCNDANDTLYFLIKIYDYVARVASPPPMPSGDLGDRSIKISRREFPFTIEIGSKDMMVKA
jgi:hypothetical protein